jgi:hypothetical protein
MKKSLVYALLIVLALGLTTVACQKVEVESSSEPAVTEEAPATTEEAPAEPTTTEGEAMDTATETTDTETEPAPPAEGGAEK